MSTDQPRWTPSTGTTQTTCENCDTEIMPQFARVFGDSSDTLWHCPECDGICSRDLRQGAGSNPDYDPETDRGDTSEHHPIFPERGADS